MRPKRGVGQGGQVLPLVAALLVLCGLGAVALGRLGERATVRARVQAAADAAALAGAVSGPGAATQLAADNGARLVSFSVLGGDVAVEVAMGGATASARARASPDSGSSMAAAMRAALARAGQLLGGPVRLVGIVPPGLEVDVDASAVARLAGVGDQAGLCRPDPSAQPARFGICPPPATALAGLES